ncbi:FecR domain-containing protein [Mariniflexile litorale]|uniref:FecR domain-containing protein n=1 Tax=Mariniflexile litorale TaxID=3045158 RepID=A0AAU7EDK0_9FLAO|nr:FecR domain-containing protein [Mariniflexile sp. KMM 9835]MDQ8212891.1 FecR domain-containing protein [Mariniflexile sp. KMM 9835]
MKYIKYSEEDFIKDEYFQKWVLTPNSMSVNFWENWIALHPEKKEIINNAAYFIKLLRSDSEQLPEENFDGIWQNIVQRRNDTSRSFAFSKNIFSGKWSYVAKIAAVFVGVLIATIKLYNSHIFNKTSENISTDITNQITLELEDGTIKIVDPISSGTITDSKGQQIIKQEQNKLLYNKEASKDEEVLTYNKLTVPYGKTFQLVLSDGSHVFLNSGSKLRYPTSFLKDAPRDVFLDGEAFFSIEKDEDRPFTVITDEMNTRVFGTKFNVTSYKNENNTSTVLVEGSVGVYKSNNDGSQKAITIAPNQRAVFKDGIIAINKVDTSKYTAWTEGKLLFIEDRFELILYELERHFDVVINNKYVQLNKKLFTGTFTDESLDDILKVCQEHTPFEYVRNGNNIIINQKQN